MAKRFSDSEKWNDVWFTELNNDQKIIWIYLLDNCDNAGIFKLNIKLINFNCSTNISVEEFIYIFKDRITQINKESWLINKFCTYQYGADFLIKTGNKAVQSAIKKLMEVKVVELINDNYTLSIPYSSPINTILIGDLSPIDSLKDKDRDKEQVKNEEQNKNKNEDRDESRDEETDNNEKVKRKHELKQELIDIFKTIPNIELLINRNDWDPIERSDKRLFNLHHHKVLEYQAIKV
jgi:hypothetical protein